MKTWGFFCVPEFFHSAQKKPVYIVHHLRVTGDWIGKKPQGKVNFGRSSATLMLKSPEVGNCLIKKCSDVCFYWISTIDGVVTDGPRAKYRKIVNKGTRNRQCSTKKSSKLGPETNSWNTRTIGTKKDRSLIHTEVITWRYEPHYRIMAQKCRKFWPDIVTHFKISALLMAPRT